MARAHDLEAAVEGQAAAGVAADDHAPAVEARTRSWDPTPSASRLAVRTVEEDQRGACGGWTETRAGG